jgi:protein-tyrosine phosphatase
LNYPPIYCKEIKVIDNYKGLNNFRELTSSRNTQLQIKEGQLFRSNAFQEISTEDCKKLSNLNIKTIIDLRSPYEVEKYPNSKDLNINNIINIPFDICSKKHRNIPHKTLNRVRSFFFKKQYHRVIGFIKNHNINLKKSREDRYRDFVRENTSETSTFLHLLVNKANYPIVFHCQGGRDRTGFLAAIIGKIIGFSEEDIIRDYLTSNLYHLETLEKQYTQGPKLLRPIYGAHKYQIKAVFDEIELRYGNFNNYLQNILDISKEEKETIKENILKKESIPKEIRGI